MCSFQGTGDNSFFNNRIEIRTLRVLIMDIQRISSYQRKTTFVNKFPKSFPFDNSMLFELSNGDKEIRTPDPLLARQVLSQLSYTPIFEIFNFKKFQIDIGLLFSI